MHPAFKQREPIKFIFVQTYNCTKTRHSSRYDIAILTESGKYIEFEMLLQKRALTPSLVEKMKQLFADFQFTTNTQACVTDTVHEDSAISLYLQLIGQQFQFMVARAPFQKIIGRLSGVLTQYENTQYTVRNAKLLWDRLVRNGKCRWINERCDLWLQNTFSNDKARSKRMARLGMYYMHMKDEIHKNDIASKNKSLTA